MNFSALCEKDNAQVTSYTHFAFVHMHMCADVCMHVCILYAQHVYCIHACTVSIWHNWKNGGRSAPSSQVGGLEFAVYEAN